MVNSFLGEEFLNGFISGFRTIITSDTPNREFDEDFNSFNEVDEFKGCFGLQSKEEDPSEPCKVVNTHKNVFLMMKTLYSGWSTKINL